MQTRPINPTLDPDPKTTVTNHQRNPDRQEEQTFSKQQGAQTVQSPCETASLTKNQKTEGRLS
jgi:hypothetical protein